MFIQHFFYIALHVTLTSQLDLQSKPLQSSNEKEDDRIDTIIKFVFKYCELAGSASA